MSGGALSSAGRQESKVRDHFERVAGNYGGFYTGETSEAHSFNVRLHRVLEMLPPKVGTMVDLGCGPGILIRCVLDGSDRSPDPSARLFGVDFAMNMLREADRAVNVGGGMPKAGFLCGEAGRLPFHDASVDTVTCMGLMEYLDDEEVALADIARVLRPCGTVIITLPNRRSPYRLWHRFLNGIFDGLRDAFPGSQRLRNIEFMVGPFTKGIVHREYSEGAYRRFLAGFGFETVDVCSYNFKVMLSPLDKWFPRLTVSMSRRLEWLGRGRLVRCLATAFIVKACKRTVWS